MDKAWRRPQWRIHRYFAPYPALYWFVRETSLDIKRQHIAPWTVRLDAPMLRKESA